MNDTYKDCYNFLLSPVLPFVMVSDCVRVGKVVYTWGFFNGWCSIVL